MDLKFGIPLLPRLAGAIGLTWGDTIYIHPSIAAGNNLFSLDTVSVIAHELLHVQQFEAAGGKTDFTLDYALEVLKPGNTLEDVAYNLQSQIRERLKQSGEFDDKGFRRCPCN